MLEAMACGLPVAAYPVTGPIDIVKNHVTGCLNQDLQQAALCALELDVSHCLEQTSEYTWEKVSNMFLSYLTTITVK